MKNKIWNMFILHGVYEGANKGINVKIFERVPLKLDEGTKLLSWEI